MSDESWTCRTSWNWSHDNFETCERIKSNSKASKLGAVWFVNASSACHQHWWQNWTSIIWSFCSAFGRFSWVVYKAQLKPTETITWYRYWVKVMSLSCILEKNAVLIRLCSVQFSLVPIDDAWPGWGALLSSWRCKKKWVNSRVPFQ